MNAKEAWEMSGRGCQNEAELKIKLACEKGRHSCYISHDVYDKCRQWLEENGFRVALRGWDMGADTGVNITWNPIEIKEP